MLQHKIINGKDVYIAEEHHHLTLAWAEISLAINLKPILITLDFHTDFYEAFTRYAFHKLRAENGREPSYGERLERSKLEASKVDIQNHQLLKAAIKNLYNDEHISFSIMAEIIDHALIIATDISGNQIVRSEEYKAWETEINKSENIEFKLGVKEGMPQPKDQTYKVPDNKMFIFEDDTHKFECSPGNKQKLLNDAALESNILKHKIDKYKNASNSAGLPSIENHPYILDIDLDYFNTIKSITPTDASFFYNLISKSSAVTIAKESNWVEKCKINNEQINSEILLERMLSHIQNAT